MEIIRYKWGHLSASLKQWTKLLFKIISNGVRLIITVMVHKLNNLQASCVRRFIFGLILHLNLFCPKKYHVFIIFTVISNMRKLGPRREHLRLFLFLWMKSEKSNFECEMHLYIKTMTYTGYVISSRRFFAAIISDLGIGNKICNYRTLKWLMLHLMLQWSEWLARHAQPALISCFG